MPCSWCWPPTSSGRRTTSAIWTSTCRSKGRVMTPFLDLSLATAEVREEVDEAIARVLDSGRYILGPEVEAFESAFAEYCGAHHCVGLASGLDALTLMLRGLDIGEGDEVIVPSNTYIATWLAVSAVGAQPGPLEPD